MKILTPEIITDAKLLSTNVTEDLYPNFDAGYSYSAGARVHVVSTDTHLVYESLINDNLGNTPKAPGEVDTKWVYVSSTNPWAMFDQSVTSQTTNAESIAVSIQTVGYISSIAILNVSGIEVHVVMTDPVEGVIYDQVHSLVSDSGIDNWYDYLFAPIVRLKDLLISDLPMYAATIVDITISAPSEIAACGAVVMGPVLDVGGTQYGAEVGIQDYSVKNQDDFGNYSILERSYRKKASFLVKVPKVSVDPLLQTLADRRATPTLYIGSDAYTSTVIYGFYKDFTIEIAYPMYSDCSIEIEGLT